MSVLERPGHQAALLLTLRHAEDAYLDRTGPGQPALQQFNVTAFRYQAAEPQHLLGDLRAFAGHALEKGGLATGAPQLGRLPAEPGKLVVLEGVYSMLGDIAPLREMVAVAKKHGAMVLVDEAHSMGFFGEHGRGVYEEQGLELGRDVDFVIGTFSKSVGTVGGFCISNHPKFEAMRFSCRPYIFTASLPPSVVATAATSIRKLMGAADKRRRLWDNARQLHGGLTALGFRLGTAAPDSAIVAVILTDQEQAVLMWQALLEAGLYVNVARPPATPAGMFLLRCSLCAEHSTEQLDRVIGMFAAAGKAVGAIG